MAKETPEKKTGWQKLWIFLNSSLFIWFLSSVAVALLTQWYTQHNAKAEAQRLRDEKISRINTEISHRLYFLMGYLKMWKENIPHVIPDSFNARDIYLGCYDRLDNYYANNQFPDLSIYDEYRNKHFAALVIELYQLDTTQKEALSGALTGYDRFEYFSAREDTKQQSLLTAVDSCQRITFRHLQYPAWKTFVFTARSRNRNLSTK